MISDRDVLGGRCGLAGNRPRMMRLRGVLVNLGSGSGARVSKFEPGNMIAEATRGMHCIL